MSEGPHPRAAAGAPGTAGGDTAEGPARFDAAAPVSVITPAMPERALDYLAPEGGVAAGAFVSVPLGPRQVTGVVWGPGSGELPRNRLRPVRRVLEVPPLAAPMRRFLERAARYTLTPLPRMLRLATRVPGLGDPLAVMRLYVRGSAEPARMTAARRRVLRVVEDHGGAGLGLSELSAEAGVSHSVIRGLAGQGVLEMREAPRDRPYPRLAPARAGRRLSPDQARAARALCQAVAGGGYGCWLLKGVTGSGKTEVYLEAVAECLKKGRQALVLLPEIALTQAFLERVEQRFGARPAEWHSGVTQAERRRAWRMVAEGGAQLVVGARSALFLPFRDLGLIVVDEEHDPSYKQEDGVLYHARDMAVLRGATEGAQVVLASATPSLESWVNARSGKYRRLDLEERFGEAELPRAAAIDLRSDAPPSGRWIAPTLERAVRRRLARGEQALLFLNRRGYAPLTVCRACGHQIGCASCDARMVAHRFRAELVCHQCGATRPLPERCPACGAAGRLTPVGPGVERIAEEAEALFPGARIAVLSSDLAGSARAMKAQIAAIAAGRADVIVGTQLVAKGHNFPLLTLVGVIDADLGLQGSDLRAAERAFQLMRQVAGRAGRAERRGEALIQTHQPDHPVIRALLSGDDEGFWQAEARQREAAGMPPFGRLAGIILSGPHAERVAELGRALAAGTAPLSRIGAQVYGPAPAPIARIRGQHRMRLLVKAARSAPLQEALAEWVAAVRRPPATRLVIDIDPQSFL